MAGQAPQSASMVRSARASLGGTVIGADRHRGRAGRGHGSMLRGQQLVPARWPRRRRWSDGSSGLSGLSHNVDLIGVSDAT